VRSSPFGWEFGADDKDALRLTPEDGAAWFTIKRDNPWARAAQAGLVTGPPRLKSVVISPAVNFESSVVAPDR
jgi:hypothetical protein